MTLSSISPICLGKQLKNAPSHCKKKNPLALKLPEAGVSGLDGEPRGIVLIVMTGISPPIRSVQFEGCMIYRSAGDSGPNKYRL